MSLFGIGKRYYRGFVRNSLRSARRLNFFKATIFKSKRRHFKYIRKRLNVLNFYRNKRS